MLFRRSVPRIPPQIPALSETLPTASSLMATSPVDTSYDWNILLEGPRYVYLHCTRPAHFKEFWHFFKPEETPRSHKPSPAQDIINAPRRCHSNLCLLFTTSHAIMSP
ncbi:hypothetical protein C8R47DRAFT_1079661 [Mycena vitilis]|nr:hypothetical protein C8R47DRAFT_1079661 [Mycena vitilis]